MTTKKKATRKKTTTTSAEAKALSTKEAPRLSPRVWKIMAVACATTVVLELFIHRHTHFLITEGESTRLPELSDSAPAAMSNWFGFYGMYGLLACCGSVLLAKALSVFLMAKEDYYDGTP